MQTMQPLVRPARYQGGKRPSFYAAYARAARRYGFETGRNAGFAKRNNVVVKVKSKHDKDTQHEVPAESIQNGELPALQLSIMPKKLIVGSLLSTTAYYRVSIYDASRVCPC